MRILLLINSLAGGGAERVFVALANHWANSGHSVGICTLDSNETSYTLNPALALHALSVSTNLMRRIPTVKFKHQASELATFADEYQPDVIYSALARANIVLSKVKRLRPNLRIVLSERNTTARTYSGWRPKAVLMRRLIRTHYSGADEIIAISGGVKESLCSLGIDANKVSVVHNPTDIADVINRSKVNFELPNPKFKFRLCCLGRLEPVKNVSYLLNVLAHMSVDTQLLVVGTGSQAVALEDEAQQLGISDRVKWYGWQEQPYPLLAASHVLVHAPLHEGFGNIIVESMALGVPPFCRNAPGGLAEIIDDGVNGRLLDAKTTHKEFAVILSDLLNSPEQLSALSAKGYTDALRFDIDRVAARYLSFAVPQAQKIEP